MGMNIVMMPYPTFMPVSTMQNPANRALQLPTVTDINGQYTDISGQYRGVYLPGNLYVEACYLLQFFYVLLSNYEEVLISGFLLKPIMFCFTEQRDIAGWHIKQSWRNGRQ